MSKNPIGYLDLLRQNPNFRYLWFGQIVSLLGDWFNVIASATLVAILTGSGIAVGWLFVIQSLAPFLVSPIAGVMADRFNRKTILILSDILRGIVLIGFLLVRDADDVWLLFTLIAIQFAISGFFFPTRNALLPDIVSSDELGTANAISAATWSVMLAFGAAMGGLVAGWFGVYTAFVVDGLTFFLSAYFIVQVVYQPKQKAAGQKAAGQKAADSSSTGIRQVYEDYVNGLRYLSQHRDIFLIATQKLFVSMLLFSPIQVINVSLSKTTFVYGIDGSLGLGLMFAIIGVGTGLGPIGIRVVTGDNSRNLRLAITICYVLSLVGVVITAPLFDFSSYLIGHFIRSIGSGTIWVFSTQLLLQRVPDEVRGRVFASEFAMFTLGSAIASGMTGWGLDATGTASILLWAMAALMVIPLVLWAGWHSRGYNN